MVILYAVNDNIDIYISTADIIISEMINSREDEIVKSTCYFSYCWDNSTEIMEYLKKEVEKKSGGKVQVIFDKKVLCVLKILLREKKK